MLVAASARSAPLSLMLLMPLRAASARTLRFCHAMFIVAVDFR